MLKWLCRKRTPKRALGEGSMRTVCEPMRDTPVNQIRGLDRRAEGLPLCSPTQRGSRPRGPLGTQERPEEFRVTKANRPLLELVGIRSTESWTNSPLSLRMRAQRGRVWSVLTLSFPTKSSPAEKEVCRDQ